MGREGDTGGPRGGSGETSPSPVCPLKQFCIILQAQGLSAGCFPEPLFHAWVKPQIYQLASQLSGPGLPPFLTGWQEKH